MNSPFADRKATQGGLAMALLLGLASIRSLGIPFAVAIAVAGTVRRTVAIATAVGVRREKWPTHHVFAVGQIDLAITETNNAIGSGGNVIIVRDNDHRLPAVIDQLAEHRDD